MRNFLDDEREFATKAKTESSYKLISRDITMIQCKDIDRLKLTNGNIFLKILIKVDVAM